MSDIRTSITLVDNFSGTAKGMAAAMSAAASECENMKKVMGTAPDMSEYNRVREQFTAFGGAERQAAVQARVTAAALDEQADKLRMSAQAAQAKADAEKKAVTVYEQEYRAYEKNANELGVLTEAQKKSIDRYREAYEEKKKAAQGAQDLADRLKLESEMADKAAQSARKEADAYGEVNTVTQKMGSTFGMAADSMSNLMMAAGGYKIMQMTAAAFHEAASAAIEFESAVTGIYKTVDGTPEQLQAISDAAREMALTMPSTTTEIAGVMESAGQLGIATDNVSDFAKTMIDLGNATNLTADQAASSLAKFANITGMSADNYRNLGSVIVDLGNNFATTEADIVNMSTYLTSAASVAGFAETDILALSAAMSSVGINAEAGGSSMSKLISEMQTAVEVGGEGLQSFADVAGMTAQQFSTEWGTNAVGALQAFIVGLNDVERNGKSMSVLLQDLDLDDIRMSNMLKAMAQGSDVMTSAVSRANTAWKENTALTNEVEKRYSTLESKMQMMGNAANDLKISVGNSLTPALGGLADVSTNVLQGLSGFAQENQAVTAGIMGTVGTLGAAIGGFTTLAPAITAVSSAYQAFDKTLSLSKIGLVAGGISLAVGAAAGLVTAFSGAKDEVEDYNGTLEQCANEITQVQGQYDSVVKVFGEQSEAAQSLNSQLELLNAQYEKGGGAAEDYAQRVEENVKAFEKIYTSYNEQLEGISSDKTFAFTAAAQLQTLSEKAVITNSDLDLMSRYADYLNNTFECDIKVNYDTKEITGFDPNDVGQKAIDAAKENTRQAAFESITSNEFISGYKKSLDHIYGIQKKMMNAEQQSNLDSMIDEMYLHHYSKIASKEDFKPVNNFQKYDYAKMYNAFKNGEFSNYYGQNSDNFNAIAEALEKYAEINQDYDNAVNLYQEQRNQVKSAFAEMDASGQAESYLASLTKDADFQPVRNSLSDYKYYMGEAGLAAEETAHKTESAVSDLSASIAEAEKAYSEMYEAARDSFEKQFGLFDEAAANMKMTVEKFAEAQQTQLKYWTDYADNVDYLSDFSAEQLGMTQEAYGKFKEFIGSGTQEAAGFAANLTIKIRENGFESVQEMGNTMSQVYEKQAEASDKVAEWGSGLNDANRQAMEQLVDTINNTASEAFTAGKGVSDSLAAGITAGMGNAISAAQSVANSVQSILSNINISVPNVSINSASDARMYLSGTYASGTMNAAPGLALVGENGPELVNFGGGEVVYTADETKRMMQGMTDVYIPQNINEAMSMKEPEWNSSWNTNGGGSQDRTININIGGDTIRVEGGVSRDDVCRILRDKIEPVLFDVLATQIFEEGEGSYEY